MVYTTARLNSLLKLKMKLYKTITAFLFVFFICITTFASKEQIAFDSANASYARGNFEKAIEQYESLIKSNSVSAEVYFNLGNAYYKTNNIGFAILNYERAKK